MYRVIGKDGREYGPIEREEIRRWIFEHRLIDTSLVKEEGSDVWVPIGKAPEFAEFFGGGSSASKATIPPSSSARFSEGKRGTLPICIFGFCLSIASFVFFLFCCFPFSLPPAGIGFILSLLGLITVVRDPSHKGKMFAIIGIIISLLVIFGELGFFHFRNENKIQFYSPVPMPPAIHFEHRGL